MENIFRSNTAEEVSSEEEDDSEGWSSVGEYSFENISDTGTLTLKFVDEEHFIEIHPIRPDLLG